MSNDRATALLRPGMAVSALVLLLAACGTGAGASTAATLPAAASGSAMPHESMAPQETMAHESMVPHETMAHESMAPHESMAASPGAAITTVAMGSFHSVDGQATGTAALLHLPDGSFEVSFEDFATPSKAHTSVLLVTNADITKTSQVDQKASLDLGALKSAGGMQEYPVPVSAAAQAMGYHAVVLWDTEMGQAVAAAPLK